MELYKYDLEKSMFWYDDYGEKKWEIEWLSEERKKKKRNVVLMDKNFSEMVGDWDFFWVGCYCWNDC